MKASSIKVYTLLQGRSENLVKASDLLTTVEQDPLIKYSNNTIEQAWAQTKINSMKAHIWRRRGHLNRALASINEGIAWLEQLHGADTELDKDTFIIRSVMYWASGHYQEAVSDLQNIIKTHPPFLYDINEMLGLIHWSMCQYDVAQQYYELAIEEANSRKDFWHLSSEHGNLGLVYLSQGKLQKSKHSIEQHRMMAEQLGSWKEQNRATANLGIVNLHQKKYDLAITLLEQARSLYDRMSALESQIVVYVNLSQAYTFVGYHEKALTRAQEAFTIAKTISGSYPSQIIVLRCLAECELLTKQQRTEYLKSALALCTPYRLFDKAACLLGLAALVSDSQDRINLKQRGTKIINELGANLWLTMHSNQYPHMLLIT